MLTQQLEKGLEKSTLSIKKNKYFSQQKIGYFDLEYLLLTSSQFIRFHQALT
jgi:predicted Zn-dependent protease